VLIQFSYFENPIENQDLGCKDTRTFGVLPNDVFDIFIMCRGKTGKISQSTGRLSANNLNSLTNNCTFQCSFFLLATGQFGYQIGDLLDALAIERVIDVFALSFGVDDFDASDDAEVLGGHGLF